MFSVPDKSGPFTNSSGVDGSISPGGTMTVSDHHFVPERGLLALFFSSASDPAELGAQKASQLSSDPRSTRQV